MQTHCICGYEFAEDMRFCPYCGKKRKGRISAEWRECEHEGGAYCDHCSVCAPWWEKYPICPEHGTKLLESGFCKKCRKFYDVKED